MERIRYELNACVNRNEHVESGMSLLLPYVQGHRDDNLTVPDSHVTWYLVIAMARTKVGASPEADR